MDNQNNLPKLRNICDNELRPLTLHEETSSEEVERRPFSMHQEGPSELMSLTGLFIDFINYSISKDHDRLTEPNRSPRKKFV